jgi:hypothetical protein
MCDLATLTSNYANEAEVVWQAKEEVPARSSGHSAKPFRVVIRHTDHVTPLYPQKLALNFADKRRLLGRYSSLAD